MTDNLFTYNDMVVAMTKASLSFGDSKEWAERMLALLARQEWRETRIDEEQMV